MSLSISNFDKSTVWKLLYVTLSCVPVKSTVFVLKYSVSIPLTSYSVISVADASVTDTVPSLKISSKPTTFAVIA